MPGHSDYCNLDMCLKAICEISKKEKKKQKKCITLAQASKSAEKEKAEQERVIEITEKFIRVLGR